MYSIAGFSEEHIPELRLYRPLEIVDELSGAFMQKWITPRKAGIQIILQPIPKQHRDIYPKIYGLIPAAEFSLWNILKESKAAA
jgi:hypothetical protein